MWVWAFVTSSAEKTRPLSTTSVPYPRAASLAATRTASERFAGPSQLSSLALRIAPVNTIGLSEPIERVARYADSSIVSVPCVTTTPSTDESATSAASRLRSAHSRSTVMCGPG